MNGSGRADDPPDDGASSGFEVHLDVFSGPFDLLLRLIAQHRLDVTEVALALVTDEFIRHLRQAEHLDLDEASEFVLVAATLLDLKAARLLPGADVEDEQDIAALEARDLLFARLLQYRSYRRTADRFEELLAANAGRVPRVPGVDPLLRPLLPDLVWTTTPQQLARLAAEVLAPRTPPEVATGHLHAPLVEVDEQRLLILARLEPGAMVTFAALVADARTTGVVVARFLAVLDLYRDGVVQLRQDDPLEGLTVGRPR